MKTGFRSFDSSSSSFLVLNKSWKLSWKVSLKFQVDLKLITLTEIAVWKRFQIEEISEIDGKK